MKCGLEIHQRLVGKKLFCNCTGSAENEKENLKVFRRFELVKSELGEVDPAIRIESLRKRKVQYFVDQDHTCLVELDEEPPHLLNQDALFSVLVISKLLNCKIIEEIHPMRKNVIDGSNTSGFQRTVLVGLDGKINVNSKQIKIQSVCLEEESAGISESGESHYILGRLGIPLVEISTGPDIESPQEAQEVALAIGSLLRKTGLVQRGLGTIRQDLNISIPGGARVEIKGVQDLSLIKKVLENEIERQKNIIEISNELKKRLGEKKIDETIYDLTSIFENTACKLIKNAIEKNQKVLGVKLASHKGLLGKRICENRRYGTELSDYVKSVGIGGIIHSDEDLSSYGFSEEEISELKVAFSLQPQDGFAIAVGEQKKLYVALQELISRANFFGVPEETRRANPDGTSSYMRPLPGTARMYPETDAPLIQISNELLLLVNQKLEQLEITEKKKEKYLSLLKPELYSQLENVKNTIIESKDFPLELSSPEISVYAYAIEKGVDPLFVASTIINTLQALKKENKKVDQWKILSFFIAYKEGKFAKAASYNILKFLAENPNKDVNEAISSLGLEKITGPLLENLITKENLNFQQLMEKYRLKVDASEAQEIFKKMKNK